jgi:hypothetical protein
MRKHGIAALCIALSGCGINYQDTGGAAAQQMAADTFRISGRADAYTGNITIEDYILLKAAETTKAAGFSHFKLISPTEASRGSFSIANLKRGTPADPAIQPGQDTYIRVLHEQVQGAYVADEIIQSIGPRAGRNSKST